MTPLLRSDCTWLYYYAAILLLCDVVRISEVSQLNFLWLQHEIRLSQNTTQSALDCACPGQGWTFLRAESWAQPGMLLACITDTPTQRPSCTVTTWKALRCSYGIKFFFLIRRVKWCRMWMRSALEGLLKHSSSVSTSRPCTQLGWVDSKRYTMFEWCEMFSNVGKSSCGCMRSTNLAAKNLVVLVCSCHVPRPGGGAIFGVVLSIPAPKAWQVANCTFYQLANKQGKTKQDKARNKERQHKAKRLTLGNFELSVTSGRPSGSALPWVCRDVTCDVPWYKTACRKYPSHRWIWHFRGLHLPSGLVWSNLI